METLMIALPVVALICAVILIISSEKYKVGVSGKDVAEPTKVIKPKRKYTKRKPSTKSKSKTTSKKGKSVE